MEGIDKKMRNSLFISKYYFKLCRLNIL
jgi:hypothetical protein